MNQIKAIAVSIIQAPVVCLSYVVYRLPFGAKWVLGSMLAFVWFDLFRIRRQVVLNNMKIVFPNLPERDRVRIARRSIIHLGTNLIEYTMLPFLSRQNWNQHFSLKGIEHLEKALGKGKGVCMMTIHTGNPDLAISGFSLSGRPFHVISKDFSIRWLNKLWFGLRSKHGTRFIPARNSSYAILKALKANESVLFVMDQFTGPPIGCKVVFFGKETGAAMGLAVLAQRSGAPVIPVVPYRLENGMQVIEIFPEIPFVDGNSKQDSIEKMTQVYTSHIEKMLLYKPDQWMWLHRRWKTFKH